MGTDKVFPPRIPEYTDRMYTRRSWREKMNSPNLPKVVDIPPNWQKGCGPGSMLIPSPRQVEALIRAVPKGRLITVAAIREILAAEHMARIACPLSNT